MRVQRAPHARLQPHPRPGGSGASAPVGTGHRRTQAPDPAVSGGAAPTRAAFTASVDLDVAVLARRAELTLVTEVVALLVEGLRLAGLLDDEAAVLLVRPVGTELHAVRLDAVVHQSTYALGARLADLTTLTAATAPCALTVVDLTGSRAHAHGDWELGGELGVVTLGAPRRTVVPTGQGPGIAVREHACLTITLRDAGAHASRVLMVLDRLVQVVRGEP